jgi:hypothetical protein
MVNSKRRLALNFDSPRKETGRQFQSTKDSIFAFSAGTRRPGLFRHGLDFRLGGMGLSEKRVEWLPAISGLAGSFRIKVIQ